MQSSEGPPGSYPLSALQLVAEGSDPNEAWTRAAERQKRCLATAVARERALVPGGVKKRPQTPKAAASAANAVSPSVPGSAKSEKQPQQASVGSGGSSQQQPSHPSPAVVVVSPQPAATPETGRTAVKPESEQLTANGTHAVANNHVSSSSPSTTAANNATTAAEHQTAPKVKLVVKQIGSGAQGTPSKGSPYQASPLQGHVNESVAAVPPELTKLEKRLIRAESLAGVWGAERFGLADTTVLLVRDPASSSLIRHQHGTCFQFIASWGGKESRPQIKAWLQGQLSLYHLPGRSPGNGLERHQGPWEASSGSRSGAKGCPLACAPGEFLISTDMRAYRGPGHGRPGWSERAAKVRVCGEAARRLAGRN